MPQQHVRLDQFLICPVCGGQQARFVEPLTLPHRELVAAVFECDSGHLFALTIQFEGSDVLASIEKAGAGSPGDTT